MTDDQLAIRISSLLSDLTADCRPSEATEILLRATYFITLMATDNRAEAGETLNRVCTVLMGMHRNYDEDIANMTKKNEDGKAAFTPAARSSRSGWGSRG